VNRTEINLLKHICLA